MFITDLIAKCQDCNLHSNVDHKVICKGSYSAPCVWIGEA